MADYSLPHVINSIFLSVLQSLFVHRRNADGCKNPNVDFILMLMYKKWEVIGALNILFQVHTTCMSTEQHKYGRKCVNGFNDVGLCLRKFVAVHLQGVLECFLRNKKL